MHNVGCFDPWCELQQCALKNEKHQIDIHYHGNGVYNHVRKHNNTCQTHYKTVTNSKQNSIQHCTKPKTIHDARTHARTHAHTHTHMADPVLFNIWATRARHPLLVGPGGAGEEQVWSSETTTSLARQWGQTHRCDRARPPHLVSVIRTLTEGTAMPYGRPLAHRWLTCS